MASSEITEERLITALADRYRIEREIGSGGMATVYLAEDLKHERQVAVKVLDPGLAETLGAERFLREIKTAANLTHPHILPVHDSGEADGFLFYVMPYVEGESLRSRLTKEKQLPVEDALQITREIADALAYAHEKRVIHRDVKPANIMLEAGHAVLADFGVAHAVAEAKDERITRTGTSLGTPAYMSPEQATGEWELDGRSDQYALACVLYEMLAGQPPFTGAQVESVVRQHLTANPPDLTQLRPSVPSEIAEVLAKALAKAPADRFATTTEFAGALAARSTPLAESEATASGLRPGSIWGIRLLALGAMAVIGAFVWHTWVDDERFLAPSAPPPWAILAVVEGSALEDLRAAVWELLNSDIGASGAIRVVSDADNRRLLERAMMPDTIRLTPEVAREIAERGRIGLVVAPRLDQVGDTYILAIQVLDAGADSVVATRRVSAGDENALIDGSRMVVDSLRPALAAWVGEDVRTPTRTPPVTGSMGAYRMLVEGWDANRRGHGEQAVDLYRQALALDAEFAAAWSSMGTAYDNMGFRDSAEYAWREALKHPARLSEFTRLWIEAHVAGDGVAMVRLRERQFRETGIPDNRYPMALADYLDRYEDAVAFYEETADDYVFGLNPITSMNWATYLLALGRVEEARLVAERLRGSPRDLPMRARVAVRAQEWEEAERIGVGLARDPATSVRWRSEALCAVASARAARGRLGGAIAALHQMIEMNERPGREQWLSVSHLNLLLLTLAVDLKPEPWHLELPRGVATDEARIAEGLWVAELGDTAAVRSYVDALPDSDLGEFDLPSVRASLVVALRGRVAGLRGDWEETVRVLEPATGHRAPRAETSTRLPNWIRAEAEEELGRLAEAAELYSQIAEGYRFGDYEVPAFGLTYSFAHRRAALLYGQLDDRDKAIEHWQAFLEAFTQPDPEFEWMVEEGRAELARLEG